MYCHICGKTLDNEARSCQNCGTKMPEMRENLNEKFNAGKCKEIVVQNATLVEPEADNSPKKATHNGMICPRCGEENLQIINEVHVDTQTTGGGYSASKGCCGYMLLGPFGLLCGACGSSAKTTTTTTNTTHFVCPKCGKKFRKPSDLRAEADKMRSAATASFIAFIVIAVLGFIILAAIGGGESAFVIAGLILAVIFVLLAFVLLAKSKGQAEQLNMEADQIERDMKKYR